VGEGTSHTGSDLGDVSKNREEEKKYAKLIE
jgi:hypothetical protein